MSRDYCMGGRYGVGEVGDVIYGIHGRFCEENLRIHICAANWIWGNGKGE